MWSNRTISREVPGKLGQTVTIMGWVHGRRNLGKIAFLDVRDRWGIIQVVCVPAELDEASQAAVKEVRPEFVVSITGAVQARQPKTPPSSAKATEGRPLHPPLAKGGELPIEGIELLAKQVAILNEAKTPPFEIENEDRQAGEELRLKYRYLDLRHARMLRNLVIRHELIRFFRRFLNQRDFLEVETPYLTKGTPEGAREFLVPARQHPGQFYVLPQSPQQFKQLLMVAGLERYYQIARCFRDEDQRGDRQPEFTQLDLEMSFAGQEDVMALTERMFIDLIQHFQSQEFLASVNLSPSEKERVKRFHITQVPFPRLTYAEAMAKYGTDKPDLRQDKGNAEELAFCWIYQFPFFEAVTDDQSKQTGWTFTHNPFSAPIPEHYDWLLRKERIPEILTTQYDIVLNGYEAGGGSIRNHRPEGLRAVLEIMGLDEATIQQRFSHMLEAFSYGAPPHGGIALGLDRDVMLLCNEPNIREVIAIPKTSDARDLLMGAPSPLPESQIREAGIAIIGGSS